MTKQISTVVSQEALEILKESYPVEAGYNKIILPRLGLISQDKTEGKGKSMKVIAEAGMFFTEVQTEEKDEDGKTIWQKDEIGTDTEVIILYQRKQLKLYDEATEKYTSSPIYDTDDEVLPLFCDKKEITRGTPADLKEKYKYTDKTGKVKSALEDNRILYVLKDGVAYQMNLRGSSMYSFLTYSRKILPPAVVTKLSSEAKEKGEIAWNQMTFTKVRDITAEEAVDVTAKVKEIKFAVEAEKAQYAKPKTDELDAYGNEAMK
jgi:hypothetical protein